jgi:hypothetical protein
VSLTLLKFCKGKPWASLLTLVCSMRPLPTTTTTTTPHRLANFTSQGVCVCVFNCVGVCSLLNLIHFTQRGKKIINRDYINIFSNSFLFLTHLSNCRKKKQVTYLFSPVAYSVPFSTSSFDTDNNNITHCHPSSPPTPPLSPSR